MRTTQRQRVIVDAGQFRIALFHQRHHGALQAALDRRVFRRMRTQGQVQRNGRFGIAEQAVRQSSAEAAFLRSFAALSSVTTMTGACQGGTGDTAWSALTVTIGVLAGTLCVRASFPAWSREQPASIPASITPARAALDHPATTCTRNRPPDLRPELPI
jgi:hypothetical protein